jgi:hypothetical protein
MTAIEWLEKQYLLTNGKLVCQDFEYAEKLEKQQIIDAFISGVDDSLFEDDAKLIADNYYQETFSKGSDAKSDFVTNLL